MRKRYYLKLLLLVMSAAFWMMGYHSNLMADDLPPHWEFKSKKDIIGWGHQYQMEFTVSDGVLRTVSTGDDPYFYLGGTSDKSLWEPFDGSKYHTIYFSVRSNKNTNIKIYYKTDTVTKWSEAASCKISINASEEFQELKMEMTGPWLEGKITNIRMDPGEEKDVIMEFKYISLRGPATSTQEEKVSYIEKVPFQEGTPLYGIGKGVFFYQESQIFPKSGANYYNIVVPLPWSGRNIILNFPLWDQMVSIAEENSIPLILCLTFNAHSCPDSEWMLDQYGNPCPADNAQSRPSLWSPSAREIFGRFIKSIVERYRDKKTIIGWGIYWGSDWWYPPIQGRFYDYSKYSQEMFRYYLREVKKYSLSDINKRYGTHYSRWQDISQPMPLFNEVNNTPVWMDFQDYRVWSVARTMEFICEEIRKYDKSRPIIICCTNSISSISIDGSIFDVALDVLKKYNAYIDVTCFEDSKPAQISGSLSFLYDVPLTVEPAEVPVGEYKIAYSLYNAIEYGAEGFTTCRPPVAGAATEIFKQWKRLFYELKDTESIIPPVGALYSFTGNLAYLDMAIHRVKSHIPLADTYRLIDLMRDNNFPVMFFSDYTDPLLLQKKCRFNAIIDTDSFILKEEVIDYLVKYVQAGGKLICFGNSGMYCKGSQKKKYLLFKKLGYETDEPWPSGREKITVFKTGDSNVFRQKEFSLVNAYALPLPRMKCKIHAVNSDGKPIVLSWQSGKGEVLLIAGSFEANETDSGLLTDIFKWCGYSRPVIAPAGVRACLKKKDSVFYLVMFNMMEDDKSGSLEIATLPDGKYQVTDMINPSSTFSLEQQGGTCRITVNLKPHQLLAYRITPAEKK